MPPSTEFEYTAIQVEQQPGGPAMFVLTVPAAGLLEWADVPSAKADYMAGYQRVYSLERAQAITDFLNLDKNNVIPGAVIVTVAGDQIQTADTEVDGVVRVTITLQDIAFEERLAAVYDEFWLRLSPAERDSVSSAEKQDEGEDGSAEDADDSGIPESYIAALTAELQAAKGDFGDLSPPRQAAIRNYIESVSKPGLIIDGQHRVFGAKDLNQCDVLLPVVLIPGLDVAEQVFHFYVLNNKAKPLSPTELRRTIATSLTNGEIDRLWKRFEDAGVDPEATRWTHKMNNDPDSPFRGLIDFGLGGGGFVRENVAYQLVSKFVNMPRKYRVLYKDVPAWQNKSDERLKYFFDFWSAVKARYPDVWDTGVAAGGNQLFLKAAMLVLQEFTLDFLVQVMTVRQMEGKPSPLVDAQDLHDVVLAGLKFLPAEFYTTEWQEKQLDTSERRAFLRDQMQKAVNNQGKFLGNLQLFKKA